ncbi:mite allergen Der p 3-like [Armigeres subalbatus]|uniref:mite allergen Der p 3-like n=1 Tax=Armigeres subalbatus TaxID=124917 RepID=UPI002ED3FD48
MRLLYFGIGSLLVILIGVELVWSLTSSNDARAPFVVSLENEGGQFCSGTILTNNWILTAASCVWNKLTTEVSIGIQSLDPKLSGYHRRPHKIYVHPDYDAHLPGANMALIKLKRSIEWNGRNVFMRLANNSADLENLTDCVIVGWNYNQRISKQLQSVDLLPNDKCSDQVPQSLCMNETDNRLCEFPEGSPLLCVKQEQYLQAGYMSGRKQCDTTNASFIVSGVADFHEWIMDVVHHKNLVKDLQNGKGYLKRLSRFNWLIFASLFFVISLVVLIQVLRSRFKLF